MNGNLVVKNSHPRENGIPRSCGDIFCIHNISPLKSIANQSLSITATFFVSSRNEKERCVTRQSGCVRDQFPTRSADYCVVTKGACPHRDLLRDRTKRCCERVHE